MSKVRINDLARELEVKSRAILDVLDDCRRHRKEDALQFARARRSRACARSLPTRQEWRSQQSARRGRFPQTEDRLVARFKARRRDQGDPAKEGRSCRTSAASRCSGGHTRATGCCHQAGGSGCDFSCSDGTGSSRRAPGTSHAGATDCGSAGSTQNCAPAASGCSDRCASAANSGHCSKTARRPCSGKASGWRCQRCRCPTWSNANLRPARCSLSQRRRLRSHRSPRLQLRPRPLRFLHLSLLSLSLLPQ